MNIADVQTWCAYFIPHCRFLKDRNDKYAVIVHVDQYAFGFFINSRINDWVKDHPKLLPCHAPILLQENESIVDYDSFVDCEDVYKFTGKDIDHYMGKISTRAKSDVLRAVDLCPKLERRYKKLILSKEGYPGYE